MHHKKQSGDRWCYSIEEGYLRTTAGIEMSILSGLTLMNTYDIYLQRLLGRLWETSKTNPFSMRLAFMLEG